MIPENITSKIGRNLHNQENHPLSIVKNRIYRLFSDFPKFDTLNPVVSIRDNFDVLLIPPEHPSRRTSDTYYWGADQVLRTQTSAHQVDLLAKGNTQFLVTGDVYRKDDADATHFPVFHQMEGVKLCANPQEDLHATLRLIINELFPDAQYKLVDSYFPFTHPSWEVEVFWEERWLEILGCGVIAEGVLQNAGIQNRTGWAFGLGLERLAMILYKIPDIRLFWTQDTRFLSQFQEGTSTQFTPYSKLPACYKDIAFWLENESEFSANEMVNLLRSIAGDLVEEVKLLDRFQHPKTGKVSHCYRVNYRSWDRTLTNEEINALHDRFREQLATWKLVLR